MKKTSISISFLAVSLLLLLAGCSEQLHAPELPTAQSDSIPAPTPIDTNRIAGVWQSADNAYRLELTEVVDAEAILSHWYINANTQMKDSVINTHYAYTLTNDTLQFTPHAQASLNGANTLKAVRTEEGELLLYTSNHAFTNLICTLIRKQGPVPAITTINKTLPQVGEIVTIQGRNLQYVTHIYLPISNGWQLVEPMEITSKKIRFRVPQAEYVQGSIRCYVQEDKLNVYSPAYMFASKGVFMHSFYEQGTTKSDRYAGSEFEYTIKDLGQLRGNAHYLSANPLPEGHALYATDIISPDSLLSFFDKTPQAWPKVNGADDKKGYLRFSSGDRFQAILNRYVNTQDTHITPKTPCSDLAIQMDIYVHTDGVAEWNTGYVSYRLNKDRTSDASVVANIAGWDSEHTMDFTDGWQTLTIPLSTFEMTKSLNIEELIKTLLNGNLQTILTIMNRDLDPIHEAHDVESFQFSIANLRLVPINTPANTIDE